MRDLTELDVALADDSRRLWAELGMDEAHLQPVVLVQPRPDALDQLKVTAKTPPPATAGVVTIDQRTYHRQWHDGKLLPGTYRIVGEYGRGWEQTLTVPSRIPTWVRSGQGRLWHRVRWAEIVWADRVPDSDLPRLRVTTWCGPYFAARRQVPEPLLADTPRGRICTKCDPTVPDRRRLPDLLEELHRV